MKVLVGILLVVLLAPVLILAYVAIFGGQVTETQGFTAFMMLMVGGFIFGAADELGTWRK